MITHYWGVSPSRIVILILLSLWLNRALYVSIFPGTFSDQFVYHLYRTKTSQTREEMHILIRGLPWEAKALCFCQKDQCGNSWSRWDGPQSYPLLYGNWRTDLNSLLSCGFLCCCLVAQLCLTLCDPLHSTLPGSSVHGISQARILEQVAISFSRESSRPSDRTCVACISRRILYPWTTRGTLWLSLPRKLPIWKAAGRGWDLSSPCICQGQLMTLKPAQ